MSCELARRIVGITIATAIVCAAIGLYIGLYLVNVPGSVAATQTSAGAQLYLATVPAAALSDPHPTWVSYYAVNANSQRLAPQDDVRAAGEHARARDDLQVRQRHGAAQHCSSARPPERSAA